MKFEWELIFTSEDKISETWRAKVIGGWIIRDFHCAYYVDQKLCTIRDYSLASSITFIPDPNHEWSIEK